MSAARTTALVAVVTALLRGCGTILNFASGDPQVYGGVQKDLGFCVSPGDLGGKQGNGALFIAGLVFAEMGASLVADTLTLPRILYLHQHREGNMDGGEVVPPDSNRAKELARKPRDHVEAAVADSP